MDARPDAPHVLAINDDPQILEIYTEILAEDGFRVTTALIPATDPAEVLALGPDVVVLDLLVGREDRGTAFLAMLRGHPATRALPVVVCTADYRRLEELEARLGVWDCGVVAKPFDVDVFLAAVRSCLVRGANELDTAAD